MQVLEQTQGLDDACLEALEEVCSLPTASRGCIVGGMRECICVCVAVKVFSFVSFRLEYVRPEQFQWGVHEKGGSTGDITPSS